MPPSIDIGLNYINRSEEKLVPNLVRINFDNEKVRIGDNPQKLFRHLDISLKGLELIIEYKNKFANIFKFIEARYEKLIEKKDEKGKINWREPITLEDIYSDSESEKQKQVKSLMNVYLWLIKK